VLAPLLANLYLWTRAMTNQHQSRGLFRRVLAYVFFLSFFKHCCAIRSMELAEAKASREGSLTSANASSLTLEVLKRVGEECARFDVDNWRVPTEDKCFVRMYRCTDNKKEKDAANHNYGDLAWGLSKECRAYGKYLKVHYIEFARVWLSQPGPYDGGVIYGKGGYEQCNHGENGFVCGCGMHGTSCGADPDKNSKSATNFGWRVVPDYLHWAMFHNYDTCPCMQYALPKRASGEVDPVATKAYIEGSGWNDRSADAYFQWKQYGKPQTIDFEKCIDQYVKSGTGDIDEIVANFKRAVVDQQEKACKS